MRLHHKVLLVLALATALVSPSLASSTTARGTIGALDSRACILTLSDKTSYQFGKGCDFSKLKIGEKVAIVWKPKGDLRLPVQVLVAP